MTKIIAIRKALREKLLKTALPLKSPQDRVGVGLARFVKDVS